MKEKRELNLKGGGMGVVVSENCDPDYGGSLCLADVHHLLLGLHPSLIENSSPFQEKKPPTLLLGKDHFLIGPPSAPNLPNSCSPLIDTLTTPTPASF